MNSVIADVFQSRSGGGGGGGASSGGGSGGMECGTAPAAAAALGAGGFAARAGGAHVLSPTERSPAKSGLHVNFSDKGEVSSLMLCNLI